MEGPQKSRGAGDGRKICKTKSKKAVRKNGFFAFADSAP
jgi:hypothetical protein